MPIHTYQNSYLMKLTEELLWRNIQLKDEGVFENYYKENYRRYFLMACKYLKDTVLAEEIVNDVFIKIWQDGEKINIQSSLQSYIYRAVINRSLNEISKQKKEQSDQQGLRYIQEEAFENREMEDNELKLRLYQAIDQLPEQCRKVFQMSRFEELKQQEIADQLGISVKTVKNHITHALKQLSKVSGDHFVIMAMLKQIFSTWE